MRRHFLFAALVAIVCAGGAHADDLTFNGTIAWDSREYDSYTRAGFEQKLNLGWQRSFFQPISLRLMFRAEGFQGTSDTIAAAGNLRTRQIQPYGEFLYRVGYFSASVRHDYLDLRTTAEGLESSTTNERTSLTAGWARERFPGVSVSAQRNHVQQPMRTVDDEMASGMVTYTLGGLTVAGTTQVARSADALAGYERNATTHGALLDYNDAFFGDRLAVTIVGSANDSRYDERATRTTETRVPFPVPVVRASFAVDDTPADGRDHPPLPIPGLNDGSVNTPTGISLGPDGVSFQNLVLDLGRTESLDEIRIVLRDDRGNPVRRVGTVTFDVYTSDDGLLWAPLSGAIASWDSAVSLYAIAFELTRSRWFKVVTFGVNPEPAFITEMQCFYHRVLLPGQDRQLDQRVYTGQASIAARPTNRLTLRYTNTYNSVSSVEPSSAARTQSDMQHEAGAEFALGRGVTAGTLLLRRELKLSGIAPESDNGLTAYVRAVPSRRLELGLEYTQRESERAFDGYSIDTMTFHSRTRVLPALTIMFDAGVDTMVATSTSAKTTRRFFDLRADAQLYPTVRLLLSLTSQRTSLPAVTDTPAFLGRARDDRASAEVTWSPSALLLVRARYGWAGGLDRSAITQQYHVDWNPFPGGAIVIGGSHEEDFDPYTNRRASRTTFRPRWIINRFATLDVNYLSFRTSFGDFTSVQRTVYAALNLTRK